MFGKKKTEAIIVSDSKELKEAVKRKEQNIEVTGNLAKKLSWMVKLSPKKTKLVLGILTTVAATVPLTGGASVTALVPSMAAVTGAELAKLILACSISAGLLIALLKDYNVEIEHDGTIVRFLKK